MRIGAISSYVKSPLLLPSSPIISQKKNTQVMMMFALAANKPMICRCTNSASAGGGGGGGAELFSVTSSTKSDVDYLGQSTRGDLNLKFGINGEATLQGPIEEVARIEAEEAEGLLKNLGIPDPFSSRHSPRGIFCSRTLNFRSISCIGYDMDYTLVRYNVKAWEGRAYDNCMDNLRNMGFPVDGLAFDPDLRSCYRPRERQLG